MKIRHRRNPLGGALDPDRFTSSAAEQSSYTCEGRREALIT